MNLIFIFQLTFFFRNADTIVYLIDFNLPGPVFFSQI